MTSRRDRVVAVIAVVVLVALAATVVALVLGAQRAGIETSEDLWLDRTRSEAAQMESRVQSAYESLLGFYSAPGTFSMAPNDPADLATIEPQDPNARSGGILVDIDGTIVN
ncbi:MAG TPA: hypothetical protein VEA78_13270, partial [Acidimicrobiales bacterium]|nr:hypothetical protein [Acidimicrobiales bacterium]